MQNRHLTKSTLRSHNLAPKKKLGQNFLVNKHIIEEILNKACPNSDDTIVEVGVGLGALTIPLAQMVKQVIGVEVDSGIVAFHREQQTLPKNVTLIHQDILKYDLQRLAEQCKGPLKIIANLPYSISNPFLFQLIDHRHLVDSAVLMLQKEVGLRIQASPSTKEYGVLSVLLGAYTVVEQLMTLGPNHFHPQPKVDSVVVKISFNPILKQEIPHHSTQSLKKVVKTAFQQRRKTLLNALASGYSTMTKNDINNLIASTSISPKIRPDALSVNEYIKLSQVFS